MNKVKKEYLFPIGIGTWRIGGFTKALADEYKGLKILTVNPGPTKTKMNDFWKQAVEPEKFAKSFIQNFSRRMIMLLEKMWIYTKY